ncbi:MAG: GNAT family N-acetyltransferase [Bacteroidota bacterium]
MGVEFYIRKAKDKEYAILGELIIKVYSSLDGFPSVSDNPDYYETFSNLQKLAQQKDTEILVTVNKREGILGGVVFYGQAKYYGSGVIETNYKKTSGIRLLAVKPEVRKRGIAKALTLDCIQRTMALGHTQLMLHTTTSMKVAWKMYEKLGFTRWEDIDFELNGMMIYGFKKNLGEHRG